MLKALIRSQPTQAEGGIRFIRLAGAAVQLVHPIHRLSHGNVPAFGEWLSSVGVPLGLPVAYAITLLELTCGLALLARRAVVPACAGLVFLLLMGIKMVHGPEGWFVVGGGRNGMEFSVLLIATWIGVAWAHWPRR